MISTNTWWESIFSGALSVGINEEKIHLLENEAFLYYTGEPLSHEKSENEDENEP